MSQTPQDRPATDKSAPAPILPAPPRAITAAVKRHAWNEPKIRATFVGALVVLAAMLYVCITTVIDWRSDNMLFSHGVVVRATAFVAASPTSANRLIKSDYVLNITYTYNGKPFKVTGSLPDADSMKYYTGQPFEIRIDPASPERWTTRKEGIPLYTRLVGVYILSVCALILFVWAAVAHWRKMRLWKLAEVNDAIVDSLGQSALAPRSTVVRCHLASDRGNATVFSVFVPPRVQVPPIGGRLRLICNQVNPSHCLVADAYAA